MAIHAQSSCDGNTITIHINGRFDFSLHSDFREIYKAQINTGAHYLIDLSKVEAMDSAALGMLLIIKEHAEANRGTVTLCHPSSDIRKILEVANFYALFTIED